MIIWFDKMSFDNDFLFETKAPSWSNFKAHWTWHKQADPGMQDIYSMFMYSSKIVDTVWMDVEKTESLT